MLPLSLRTAPGALLLLLLLVAAPMFTLAASGSHVFPHHRRAPRAPPACLMGSLVVDVCVRVHLRCRFQNESAAFAQDIESFASSMLQVPLMQSTVQQQQYNSTAVNGTQVVSDLAAALEEMLAVKRASLMVRARA